GHEHADAPHSLGLLRACRERPRGRRAAERHQQFPPSDGDCHTPLPCEVRKSENTTPSACSLPVQRGARCWLLPPLSSAAGSSLERVNVFRFAPESRHRPTGRVWPLRAQKGLNAPQHTASFIPSPRRHTIGNSTRTASA